MQSIEWRRPAGLRVYIPVAALSASLGVVNRGGSRFRAADWVESRNETDVCCRLCVQEGAADPGEEAAHAAQEEEEPQQEEY